MDIVIKVSHLMDVVENLVESLTEETSLLRQQRIAEILPLQAEKERLFTLYEALVLDLQQRPGQLKEVEAKTRQALRQSLKKFHYYAHQNKIALKAARDARRIVLSAIRESALAQQSQGNTYSADGMAKPVYKRTGSAAVSVAMDKNL